MVDSMWATIKKLLPVTLGLSASLAVSLPSVANAETSNNSLADGIYLQGQSPQTEQIGSTYTVFEIDGDTVVGAFYMPRSSFDCFYGRVEDNALLLTVVDSYSGEASPFSIALNEGHLMADSDGSAPGNAIALDGFYNIETVSGSDSATQTLRERDYLSTCQAYLNELARI